ncbi:MAG TPA: right-handed parallel beta-helix repeat-containing protein [Dokdonella sp.]|uniref:right-handed parallel beta-helix repeat-containing protein n=1 Tax=Dokdonella sp. TaxID=2291710 RepID=UPI002D80CBE8|nr:right-handed parallel beta-helix repeat-containing protein [Dokdonella sp.]HET9033793.1 right-handed parallel beta-helix repeat-containing protein [Dokdonella sp.]
MPRHSSTSHPLRMLRRKLLALSLCAALSDVAMANALPADVPLQWPLAHERSAQTTALRARLDAMRVSRPAPRGSQPRVLEVTNCADDDSAGSLRNQVELALSGDTIDLSTLTCSTISLSQGALKIALDDLSLIGPGADQLTLDAENRDRIILHPGSGTLTLQGLTIAHGRFDAVDNDIGFGGCVATGAALVLRNSVIRDCLAVGVGSYGGAVLSGLLTMQNSTISDSTAFGDHPTNGTAAYGGGAFSYGVAIFDSTISGNSAIGTDNAPLSHWEIGGGLFVARNGGRIERSTISDNFAIRFAGGLTQEGYLELSNSTISGNRTEQDDGGGLRVRQVTSVAIENSTITNNHAGSHGGGISFIDNALPSIMISTLVAGNSSNLGGADANSTMPLTISGSSNLIVASNNALKLPADTIASDPHLGKLADNGGPTRTHALAKDSPAIDHGSNPDNFPTDQRGNGFLREAHGRADIGAYEVQASTETIPLPGLGTWSSLLLAGLLAVFGIKRH